MIGLLSFGFLKAMGSFHFHFCLFLATSLWKTAIFFKSLRCEHLCGRHWSPTKFPFLFLFRHAAKPNFQHSCSYIGSSDWVGASRVLVEQMGAAHAWMVKISHVPSPCSFPFHALKMVEPQDARSLHVWTTTWRITPACPGGVLLSLPVTSANISSTNKILYESHCTVGLEYILLQTLWELSKKLCPRTMKSKSQRRVQDI